MDKIDVARLSTELQGTLFAGERTVHYHRSVRSTNVAATEAAAAGAQEGEIYLADEQTGGRGRGGHTWHSPPGDGIYLSTILRPQLPAAETLWISLIAGLAVHAAIQEVAGISVDLRWPNDIMLGEKKIGGILTEISTEGDRVRYAVVGIGVNVNHDRFPAEISPLATSLRIVSGRTWARQALIAALLKSLHEEYAALQQGNAASSILKRFEAHSSYARGARVSVDDFGCGPYRGTTAGLDHRGFLQVEVEDGVRTVISGGVRKI